MNNRERETEFLRHCIGYDDTDARHDLEAKISQAQRDERCVRRAVWVVVLLTAVGLAGLCYAAIFVADFPNSSDQRMVKTFGALGLGSLICLPGFLGFWGFYRKELNLRREECRRLAAELLETRLGKRGVSPQPVIVTDNESVDEQK
jgi:hypothetical protein